MQLDRRIGKFDSPESLLKGYEELEKEFTKRCQKLKELEKEHEKLSQTLTDREYMAQSARQMLSDSAFVDECVVADEGVKNRVIENYLSSLNKGVSVIGSSSGRAALAPPAAARTLLEAKALADKILNG